jgi:hypothetical protein
MTANTSSPTELDRAERRAQITVAIVIGQLLLLGLPVVLFAAPAKPGTALLTALAATATGLVLGFLFGIPRGLSGDNNAPTGTSYEGGAGTNAAGTSAHQPRRLGNASLEQVADWLTKLLIGAGLTQLGPLKDHLQSLARQVSESVSPPNDPASPMFGLALIGYFGCMGFLGGYLATRLLLARLLVREELAVDQLTLELVRKAGREEGRRQMEEVTGGNQARISQAEAEATRAAGADATLRQRLEAAKLCDPGLPPTVWDDPQKGRFGGQATTAERFVTANVKPVPGTDEEWFDLVLTVAGKPGAPALESPVKFFLHQTINPDNVVVMPRNGTAQLNLRVWGAFTVGAITDEGRTKLELDLSELPGAPAKFRSR